MTCLPLVWEGSSSPRSVASDVQTAENQQVLTNPRRSNSREFIVEAKQYLNNSPKCRMEHAVARL
jgi:hypothetical protein